MKANRRILNYSLFVVLVGLTSMNADAGLRVGNQTRGYAVQGYQQVNVTPNAATTEFTITTPSTDTENNLPVRVADEELMADIVSGTTNTPVAFNQLEQCSMIYPNGEFAWDRPTLGLGAGGADTCVAVVELRGYQAGLDGSDVVLARATLAAGDSVNCNIESFPEATMNISAVENFTFPADAAPTMDDVVKQMNQEQKQNAGLKIAAGAIIGGLGGNMLGSSNSDSLLGTDKGNVQGTVIGALSGAALMAGNAYAGKITGDVILSTGVNAAAGGLVGNMSGTGNSVLRIEDCTLPDGTKTTCLWGALITSTPLVNGVAFYNIDTGDTYVCDSNFSNCEREDLVSIKLDANSDIEEITEEQFEVILSDSSKQYYMANNNNGISMVSANDAGSVSGVDANMGIFVKVLSAGRIDRQIPAMIAGVHDKAFGMTQSDWREWKNNNSHGQTVYGRSTSGTAYALPSTTEADIQNFYPMMVDAEGGSLIDLGNKARLKSTLIGAGVGGALGGLAGYQGAQLDVQNRWVTAVREYEDSLNKVYCATGNRYLSKYNDTIYIPNMTVVSE